MKPLVASNTVLVALNAFGGRMSGRTLLQKRLFFIGELLQWDLGYDAHFYGPFADEISSGLMELKLGGLLKEEVYGFGGDSLGFERRRYDYQVTEQGLQGLAWLRQHYPEQVQAIEQAVQRIRAAGDLDYMSLSIAAKAYWILKGTGEPLTPAQIAEKAASFSWQVTPQQVQQAIGFLEKLGLITTNRN